MPTLGSQVLYRISRPPPSCFFSLSLSLSPHTVGPDGLESSPRCKSRCARFFSLIPFLLYRVLWRHAHSIHSVGVYLQETRYFYIKLVDKEGCTAASQPPDAQHNWMSNVNRPFLYFLTRHKSCDSCAGSLFVHSINIIERNNSMMQ